MEKEAMEQKNVFQRMLALMADVGSIKKVMTSGNMKYDYIPVDAIKERLRPLLVKHGLYLKVSFYDIISNGNNYECKCLLSFINVDNPGDYISDGGEGVCSGFGLGLDNQDKGPGKAQSYAFKNAVILALMLEGGEDVEADQSPLKSKRDKEADLNKSILDFTSNFKNRLSAVSSIEEARDVLMDKGILRQLKWLKSFRLNLHKDLEEQINNKLMIIFDDWVDCLSDEIEQATHEYDIVNITTDNAKNLEWCKKDFPGLYKQLDSIIEKKRDALKRQVEND